MRTLERSTSHEFVHSVTVGGGQPAGGVVQGQDGAGGAGGGGQA